MNKKKERKQNKRKDESGVITVEACTSLMIFVFAFYIVIELMKVFAVEACMQDVLTSVAMDASMGRYYGGLGYRCEDTAENYGEYRTMNALAADDFSDDRLNNLYSDSLYEYHMKEQSNLKRLILDEKVMDFSVDSSYYADGRIVVSGEYRYRLLNVPFLKEGGFVVFFNQQAVTYAWE